MHFNVALKYQRYQWKLHVLCTLCSSHKHKIIYYLSYQCLRQTRWLRIFLSLISHGWVVTFQDSHRTVFTFRSWLDLLGVVLAFWISILKIYKLLQNCWHRVIDITSFEKHLESSLDHTLNFCRDSFSHQTWARFQPGGAQPALFGCRYIYFWYIIFINYAVCVLIFMTSQLGVAVGLLSI